MELGSKARHQLQRFALDWKQGEHVLVSGPTGSGKTVLARYLDQIRIHSGSSVVVFIGKIQPDETIEEFYSEAQGWVRWHEWPDKPNPKHTKVLLWPKVEGLSATEALPIFRKVFNEALDKISAIGKWVVHLDEGLFITSPSFVGAGDRVSLMSQLIRSAKGTLIILVQRPSHIPLAIYSNISYAFVGRASNASDRQRIAEMDASVSPKEIMKMIEDNGKHDFTVIRLNSEAKPETINLAK